MVEGWTVAIFALLMLVWFIERHAIVLTFHSTSLGEGDTYTLRPRKIIAFVQLFELLDYRPASLEQFMGFAQMKATPRRSFTHGARRTPRTSAAIPGCGNDVNISRASMNASCAYAFRYDPELQTFMKRIYSPWLAWLYPDVP